MTSDELRAFTRKELADRAKKKQIAGWHAMRKEELVKALLAARSGNGKGSRRQPSKSNGLKSNGRITQRQNGSGKPNGNGNGHSRMVVAARRRLKPTRSNGLANAGGKDYLIAEVCDSHWVHVRWLITREMIGRAQAALGTEWHLAMPVIRVLNIAEENSTTGSETRVRDIEIHGDVDHWYIPVDTPPGVFQFHIGYLSENGSFFSLVHSNRVKTPRPGSVGTVERRRRESGNGNGRQNGNNGKTTEKSLVFVKPYLARRSASIANGSRGHSAMTGNDDIRFEVNAELIVHGKAHPKSKVTLLGEPVSLGRDGSFSLRFSLPEGRQIIPVVALTPDGTEQRTVVLGIERNTKSLEPRLMEDPLT